MKNVSVIIPVYNTEKYLRKCVDSILAQQDVDLELVLVDDGSKDSSPTICDEYAKEYPNVQAIHIKNSGPATAKNEGLKMAKGEYIALLDSDDELKPEMLGSMYHAGLENNADIICCGYMQVDEQGNISHTEHTGDIIVSDHEDALRRLLLKDKVYSQCWTKIYRRAMLDEYGIRNDDGLRTEEDFMFNIRAFRHSHTCVVIDKPLYIYTHRERSLAHDYFRQNISQFIDNRIRRTTLTDKMLVSENAKVRDWGYINNIMYFNELIGKVALFPEQYGDKRISEVIKYIRKRSRLLVAYHELCGFSKAGCLLIQTLPQTLYLRYRHRRA